MSLRASLILLASVSLTASAQKWDGIHPIGEENLGTITIHEPNWSSPEEKHVFPYTLQYRSVAMQAEFAKRFLAGDGCLMVSGPHLAAAPRVCDVTVEKKKQRDYYLSGMVLRLDRAANNPLEVDFGLRPSLTVMNAGNLISNGTEPWLGTSPRGVVVAPGDYKFSFNLPILDTVEKNVSPREVLHLDLTPPDRRARVAVHMPERLYPTPTSSSACEQLDKSFLIQRTDVKARTFHMPHPYDIKYKQLSYSGQMSIASFLQIDTVDKTYRMFPYPDSEKLAHYELVVNNLLIPLTVAPGRTLDVTLKRIDVDDVLVTKESGEKVYVKGTYTLARKDLTTGNWEPIKAVQSTYSDCSGNPTFGRASFPTKTGLDLVPGIYRAVVSYATEEGAKTQEYELDLSR